MTQTTMFREDMPPDLTLTRLVDRHGAWAMLRTFVAVLWRRRTQRAVADTLPDHLRRDVGLAERSFDSPPLRGPWL